MFQAHITFNHPLGRPAGQPATDHIHIQPPRYPLPVPACLLPILQPRLGSALERPRVCRSIYLNVLSRFVLITLPENTHTPHTHPHTHSLLIGAFKLKGVSRQVQVASGAKHDKSSVYCALSSSPLCLGFYCVVRVVSRLCGN